MMDKIPFELTREKHLDHMVKVVPLIVMGYAIQSYVLMNFNQAFGFSSILFLGLCLISMIGCFITYDVKHKVVFHPEYLEVSFLWYNKIIQYHDIDLVKVSESNQTFASVTLFSNKKKYKFYFVDEADKIKNFLETCKKDELKAAA